VTFIDVILEERSKHDKSKKTKRVFNERTARKDFREYLKECHANKTITYRKKWKSFI
jgi:hypothetical protein